MTGPLAGHRIIEIASIGPGPFACMMLADHGAEVIRVERPGGTQGGIEGDASRDVLMRSRRRIEIDLKSQAGREVVLDLIAGADGLVEGFRPGVMERLGLGPEAAHAVNPALIYGRMTGWGQTGPLAQTAGHDINYISVAGALHAFGRKGQAPVPPVNMVADFGGGGMMLAFGMLAALIAAKHSGRGTVVDAAMTDGTAVLMAMVHGLAAQGHWRDERGVNALDTGAHFYDVYETKDGRHISLGPIEPKFHATMLSLLGLDDDPAFAAWQDPSAWDDLRSRIAAKIATRTRAEWDAVFEGSDACYAPILSLGDAPDHPHNRARQTFTDAGGVIQPAPAPRYSAHATVAPVMADGTTQTHAILRELGYDAARIAALVEAGGIG